MKHANGMSGLSLRAAVAVKPGGGMMEGLNLRNVAHKPGHAQDNPMKHNSPAPVKMSPHGKKGQKTMNQMFSEVHENVPGSVKKSGKKGKAKNAMMTAIALSKARAAGVKIPKKKGY